MLRTCTTNLPHRCLFLALLQYISTSTVSTAAATLYTCTQPNTSYHNLTLWPFAAPPVPNRTLFLHGAAHYTASSRQNCTVSFADLCTHDEHALPLVVHVDDRAAYIVCRCDAKYFRAADSRCRSCASNELCPPYSDVRIAQHPCASFPTVLPSTLEVQHLRDPVQTPPCATPLGTTFSPLQPFFFSDATTVQVSTAARAADFITHCPDGMRLDPRGGDRGLVWKIAETFTADARFELQLPSLGRRRYLVPGEIDARALTDDGTLDRRAHAVSGGRVWVPDFGATCVICEAGKSCRGGQTHACDSDVHSVRVGATTCENFTALPPTVPSCPPLSVNQSGPCVCLGDRWPVRKDGLQHPFACLRQPTLRLEPGKEHVRAESNVVRGRDRAGVVDATLGVLRTFTFQGAAPVLVDLPPGGPWRLAGLTDDAAVLFMDDILSEMAVLSQTGGVQKVSVTTPQEVLTAPERVEEPRNNVIVLEWFNATLTGIPREYGFVAITNTGLGPVFGNGSTLAGKLSTPKNVYDDAGVDDVDLSVCVLVDNVVLWCPDPKKKQETDGKTTEIRFVHRDPGWREERFDVHAFPDRSGVVVLYEFGHRDQDDARAWSVHCFSPEHPGAGASSTLVYNATLHTSKPCPLGDWQRGDVCVSLGKCALAWSGAATHRPLGLAHGDLEVPSVDGQYLYRLARTSLAKVATRKMMFGERVRAGAGRESATGWWYVEVRAEAAAAHAGVRPRGGLNCSQGFKAMPEGRCELCDAGTNFCENGWTWPCPENSKTEFAGSIVCVCESGYFRARGKKRCVPCPLHSYCEHEARKPCPGIRMTTGNGSTSIAACQCPPGFFKNGDDCVQCAAGKSKPDISNHSCTDCPEEQNALPGSKKCGCRRDFYGPSEDCKECPANHACPLGNNSAFPTACSLENNEILQRETSTCVCVPGWFRNYSGGCQRCVPGMFCAADIAHSCPRGMTSPEVSSSDTQCTCRDVREVRVGRSCVCAQNTTASVTGCRPCPEHSSTDGVGATARGQCKCDAGFFWQAARCVPCPRGHFCPRGVADPVPCPPRTFAPGPGVRRAEDCLPCDVNDGDERGVRGQWHPAVCDLKVRTLHVSPPPDSVLNVTAAAHVVVAGEALHDGNLADIAELVRESTSGEAVFRMHHAFPAQTLQGLARQEFASVWKKLQQYTAQEHRMFFVLVVVGVFCLEVEAKLRTGEVVRCEAPVMLEIDADMRRKVDDVMLEFLDRGVDRLQTTPNARILHHDLERDPRGIASSVLSVEQHGLLLGPSRSGAWGEYLNRVLEPPLSVIEYQSSPAPCARMLEAVVPSCVAATAVEEGGWCTLCAEGEFRDVSNGNVCKKCAVCETYARPCCGTEDAQCRREDAQGRADPGLCLNEKQDYGEECDPTAEGVNKLAKCCTASCVLKPGYYVFRDGCKSVCGDGVKAEDEECDDLQDPTCDVFLCRKL